MNLTLTRNDIGEQGAFGAVTTSAGLPVCVTCEHTYQDDAGNWAPKIPPGTYTCVRGQHQLDGMPAPFETFEVTGIDGHSGLLFHKGNTEADSHGCILVGSTVGSLGGDKAVLGSSFAFDRFLALQSGVSFFILTVQ